MRWSLPFGDRLVWVLLAVSAAFLAWGFLAGSSGLVTLGAIGLALTLFAYTAVPRLLGRPPDDEGE